MLKLSLITDIHHGPTRGTKQGGSAIRLFDNFLSHINQMKPDYVIDLGDRISDVGKAEDRILLQEINESFKKVEFPFAHLLGNHDIEELSVQDNEDVLGCSLASSSIDLNGYHLVFWNCNTKLESKIQTYLKSGDLEWLQEDLSKTNLPTIIFTHFPLGSGAMKGNFYFEKAYPQHAQYPDEEGERIRDVIERSERVILCVNGHAHWNAYQVIDGIHYVTIPSLTEMFTTYPDANETWADIRIDQEIEIQIYGRTPMLYRFPAKKLGTHWANMHKSYAPKTEKPA